MMHARILLSSLLAALPLWGQARTGELLFRQECVSCHGVGAKGGIRGPDLTIGQWAHGGSDAELARTIANGVPGTAMPENHLPEEDVRQIVTYLRSLQKTGAATAGDLHRGEALFFGTSHCASCHMVHGKGGRLGPELSYAGSARPREYLVESIREPNKQITENLTFGGNATMRYDTVIATTADGKTVTGVPMNEDTFIIQIMDAGERIYSLQKKALKSLRHENRSLMPAYGAATLSEKDLEDMLAYLQSLRAPSPAPEKGADHDNR